MRAPWLVRRVRAALVRCPAHCGEDDPSPRYLDRSFALGEISPDQAKLARVIAAAPGSRMLHIGVGCSDLARRFTGVQIDGITVLDDEVAGPDHHDFMHHMYGDEPAAWGAATCAAGS